VSTLKRLLREVFADLVKVQDRLNELEAATGISSEDIIADATPLASKASSSGTATAGGKAGSKLRSALSGVLRLGGGLVWDDDNEDAAALDAVQDAGVRLDTDVLLQLGGPVRGGNDTILAEVKVDQYDALSMQKVLYNCKLAPGLRMVLAPFGARGQDVAFTLNPFSGQGLGASVEHGSPLHQRILGAVVAAAVDLRRAWLSAAYFSHSGEGGVCDTAFAQAVVAPLRALSLGLTVVEPLRAPDAAGSGVQLAVAGKGGAAGRLTERQLGATMALSVGGAAVHGWASAAADSVEKRKLEDVEWGLTLGPRPDGSGTGWALGIGKCGPGIAPGPGEDPLLALQPNVVELSTHFNVGDGLVVTPGVVMLRRNQQPTMFAGFKTIWQF